MQIQRLNVAELLLDPSNVRKHDRKNLDAIKASLKKFGQQKPIVVDAKGIVLAGNGTLTAARELGWTEIEVTRTELTGSAATAFAIADNRSAELATWEEDKLAQVLQSLKVEDADLFAATGYDDAEVDKMIGAEVTADEVPEPPAEPITKAGDLWLLGDHRVLCGDSTKAEDVERLMAGAKACAVLTDPPYGINQPGVPNDEPYKLAGIVQGAIKHLPIENSVVVAFQSTRTFPMWLDGTRKAGHQFERMLWLYKEAQCTFPWRGWILKSESILVSTVGDGQWQDAHPFSHDCYKLSEVSKELEEGTGWHGSVKPVRVVADILKRIAPIGERIYDPFLGSGTTLIAAEQLNRKCYGLEISPAYCDVIVQRWENLTGKKAVLENRTP